MIVWEGVRTAGNRTCSAIFCSHDIGAASSRTETIAGRNLKSGYAA
jgi:hypothetical protein